jgi:hypothetical protein
MKDQPGLNNIGQTAETTPYHARAGQVFAAGSETAQLANPAHNLLESWNLSWELFGFMHKTVERLPFIGFEQDRATHLGDFATEQGQIKYAPGHHPIDGQEALDVVEVIEWAFFDPAAAFQDR